MIHPLSPNFLLQKLAEYIKNYFANLILEVTN